ncbi:hypothetical protein Q31b_57990 [Novipirellula aureliae]|uniref:Uncharacterized protein n=1 Tax=Novipirellula aureliae TaxID=2527966 RepID=A0A5C6DD00_9BACT|nr:hypothetical protein Q31b_57990 [Novipirellula aureliae]
MTMKYTHIGIEDQAKALSVLPTPWQDIGRSSTVRQGHSMAEVDTPSPKTGADTNNKSPVKNGAFVRSCQSESADADKDPKRRTRDSPMEAK